MADHQKNKVKAIFFLSVFSLNLVVGFVCSVGLDMGFNSNHHNDVPTEAVVHHAGGKKHIHSEKKNTHFHNKPEHLHQNHQNPKDEKNNCCNDQVLQFEKLDKSVPHALKIIHPIFLIAFFDVSHNVALYSSGVVKNIKQFVRSYHPPISDIRIAIQSFQI